MEEQIKQKYEMLLSGKEEQGYFKLQKQDSRIAEKSNFSIGQHLRRARLWKGLSLEQAACGICRKNTLERLEKGQGENFSGFDHHFLLRTLLNRMGMFAGKFEFYDVGKERQKENLREWLVAWRRSLEPQKTLWISPENQACFFKELGLPEDASYEDALNAYEAVYHAEWEQMWVLWQKRIRRLSQDALPEDEAGKVWEGLCAQKLFFTQEEWEFLYTLAEHFKRRKEYKKAAEIYRKMYRNVTGEGMDDERQLELLPGFCLIYGRFLWECENGVSEENGCGNATKEENGCRNALKRENESGDGTRGENGRTEREYAKSEMTEKDKAEDILLHGICLNRKYRRLYFLYDLMEMYCTVLYGRVSDASKEKLKGCEKPDVPKENEKNQKETNGKPGSTNAIAKYLEEAGLEDENERKIVMELLGYESYLVALEMAQKQYGKAKKRMVFIKEELGWEASTLAYTYDVSGKHQD